MSKKSEENYDVVVVGSLITDFVSYVPQLPRCGETLKGSKFVTGFGGKGANQCVAASNLGSKTAMIGKLGNDTFGELYKAHLEKHSIDVQNVQLADGLTTGVAQICVSSNGSNHIVIVPGANDEFKPADVNAARDTISKGKVLVCQLEVPMETSQAAMNDFSGTVILNLAPAPASNSINLFIRPDILCLNEIEAASVTKSKVSNITEAKETIDSFLCLGVKCVIITLGANGAIFATAKEPKPIHLRASICGQAVDTTGAGDAFVGALAHFIATLPDLPLVQQIGGACYYATQSVLKPGTQSSYPSLSELQDFDIKTKEFSWSYV